MNNRIKNQNNKEFIENVHFEYFLQTEVGKKLLENIKCYSIVKTEKPDFLLKTPNGDIGFELTVLSENSKYTKFSYSLKSVVESVFKKIDNNLTYQYFINLICEEENINNIVIEESKLSEQIFSIISDYEKMNIAPQQQHYTYGAITIKGAHHIVKFKSSKGVNFKLIFSKTTNNINVVGSSIFSPITLNPKKIILQLIRKKELKKIQYNINCTEHCLLIIVDPFISKGNSYTFDEEFYNFVFSSSFNRIFLLELGGEENIKATQLKLIDC